MTTLEAAVADLPMFSTVGRSEKMYGSSVGVTGLSPGDMLNVLQRNADRCERASLIILKHHSVNALSP